MRFEDLPDDAINARLVFAERLISELLRHGKPGVLPEHLELERSALVAEQLRRVNGVGGDGI